MTVKIFLSYSHKDEEYIKEFIKHISPFKGKTEIWYDRKLHPGSDFEEVIDNNLENADIVCLFISSNYLSSESCQKEKSKALEIKNKRIIKVVPIILSPCLWMEEEELSKLLALPTDGKPISTFSNQDEGWVDVCNNIKALIENILRFKQLKISKEFAKFLNSVEALTNSHPYKDSIYLDDIFIPPEFHMFDESREHKGKVSFEDVLNKLTDHGKIAIFGDSLSGKTTLCKMIFRKLKDIGFIPVYINDRENQFKGRIINKIKDALKFQYENADIEIILQEKERIVPIIDDFHYAKNKEKIISELSQFPMCVKL